MCKDELKEVVRAVLDEVVGYKDRLVEEELDARYQDVKLLMKNYRKLRTYYERVSPEVLEVNAICSMRHKTKLMMSHVDKMLTIYGTLCRECDKADEFRRWEVLYLRYIADERLTVDEIAAQLEIDRRTFYRDINKAIEDMAVLLFGIEAIGTWKHSKSTR